MPVESTAFLKERSASTATGPEVSLRLNCLI